MSTAVVKLTEERMNRGLSKSAMARECKIALAVWQRAENGEPIAPGNALKIATFLNYKVTDIWPVGEESAAA